MQFLRPPRRCRPFGQTDEVLGKPVERGQHGNERRRDLHDGAERQLTREIFGRRQQHRKHGREKGVAVENPGQVAVLAHDVEPARRHGGEGLVEPLALVIGALDQRDALGVLAHARQLVAELRLALVLGGHAVDERAADQVGEDRGGGGVQHRGNGDVAWNPYARAADVDRQRSADPEQDADERDGGQQGIDEADGELHHRLGGQAQIVGDAVFGIDLFLVGDRQAVVALFRQPARQHLARQPLPPFHLQRHAAPDHGNGECRTQRHQHHDDEDRGPQRAAVLALQRVEEPLVPPVDADVDGEVGKHERQGAAPSTARHCGCSGLSRSPTARLRNSLAENGRSLAAAAGAGSVIGCPG